MSDETIKHVITDYLEGMHQRIREYQETADLIGREICGLVGGDYKPREDGDKVLFNAEIELDLETMGEDKFDRACELYQTQLFNMLDFYGGHINRTALYNALGLEDHGVELLDELRPQERSKGYVESLIDKIVDCVGEFGQSTDSINPYGFRNFKNRVSKNERLKGALPEFEVLVNAEYDCWTEEFDGLLRYESVVQDNGSIFYTDLTREVASDAIYLEIGVRGLHHLTFMYEELVKHFPEPEEQARPNHYRHGDDELKDFELN
ncbi:MAG: hypothetical protein QGH47_00245 [Candidatus Woesearchaeota archaeon]|jgi:hypothetical protein|nr:hypothetical protein [Candidatus Woesearchaeota archaeon]